ncbi:MAG: replicative DNA helicase [Finegoldia magna]|uniref:replicative DNA helicase n=1 Tax=Finegoldia magna TaxID=1260 RepID=UPI00290011A3|nr:replicative DNA helicase [Finegoldia magna]MDU1010595.1 replicative DNA helicase [Finegoldia magna]MDU1087848.1 replicative DNA helicase [Finegoldia magna]
MENQQNIMPCDLEAERSVIGAMIIDERAVDDAAEIVEPIDFYSTKYQEIYKAILQVIDEKKPVDYITLEDKLKSNNMYEIIGGIDELISISEAVGSAVNVKYYADIIKSKAIIRNLMRVSQDVIDMSIANNSVGEVLEYAESNIFKISQNRNHQDLVKIQEMLEPTLARIGEMSVNQGKLTGVTTGLIDLDRQLSGLQNSDLILLAARPAMGKTSLALNIAYKASVEHHVAIFSLEMSKMQLTQRLLSALSNINLSELVSGKITEWTNLGQAAQLLAESKMFVDDTSSISLNELRSKCRKLKARGELDLVIIDYLQLMTTNSRSENRQQEISTISRGLKGLAKELNCPILALSQLSRAPDQRPNHRPVMSDLRESGAIEQDADVVLMLYRDDYYDPETDKPNIAEIIVAKHRNGPTGTVDTLFDKEHTKFMDLDKQMPDVGAFDK